MRGAGSTGFTTLAVGAHTLGLTQEGNTVGKPQPDDTAVLSTELVPFHGSMLEAGKADGKVWVIVRRVCRMLEIDEEGQRQRLDRTPWATTCVMKAVAEDGKIRDVFCIDMDSVPMWLATIHASWVAPHLREKLVLFQKEAARFSVTTSSGRLPRLAAPSFEPKSKMDRQVAKITEQAVVVCEYQTFVNDGGELRRTTQDVSWTSTSLSELASEIKGTSGRPSRRTWRR